MSLRDGYDLINLQSLFDFFNTYYEEVCKTKAKRKRNTKRNTKTIFTKDAFLKKYLVYEIKYEDTQSVSDAYRKIMSGNRSSSQIVRECFDCEYNKLMKNLQPKKNNNIEQLKLNMNSVYNDKILLNFSSEEIDEMFRRLGEMCRTPHFSDEECARFRQIVKEKKEKEVGYREMLYLLALHALTRAYYNLPYMYTERLYQEALTIKVHNRMRDDMLQLAADNGHQAAALEYASRRFETDLDEGVTYLLLALPQLAAYWSLAFQLETRWDLFNEAMLERINQVLTERKVYEYLNELHYDMASTKRESEYYVDVYPVVGNDKQKECMGIAVKIYQYLCTHEQFSKAYNSIGKLLIKGMIRLKCELEQQNNSDEIEYYPESRKEAFRFLNHAIAIGNGNALVNIACYVVKHTEDPNFEQIKKDAGMDYDQAIESLRIMADLHEPIACEFYGNYLWEKNEIESALPYFEYIASRGNVSVAKKLVKKYTELEEWEKVQIFSKQLSEKK